MSTPRDTDTSVSASAPTVKIFCSYRHVDNDGFAQTVDHLVSDLKSLHEAETGRALEIFFDRSDIGWGDNLGDAIDHSITDATFFMPIITARYFESEWCRYEFLSFHQKCKSLGVTELILPIVLAGSSLLREESADEIISIVSRIQYADWSDIWQNGPTSQPWNIEVTRLVRRLISLRESVESRLVTRVLEASQKVPATTGDATEIADRQDENAGIANNLLIEGQVILDRIDRAIQDSLRLLANLDRSFRDVNGLHVGIDQRAHEGMMVDHASKAYAISRDLRALFDDVLDFDVALQMAVRVRRAKLAPFPDSIGINFHDFQQRAAVIEGELSKVAHYSTVLRRLDASVPLRAILSPLRNVVQSLRDMTQILYGWMNLEVA